MEKVYTTDNIRLAASLATIGFKLLDYAKVEGDTKKAVFVFEPEHNGVTASYFESVYTDSRNNEVDEIVERYGIDPGDVAKIMFDAANIAQKNRTTLHLYLDTKQAIFSKRIGDRMLLYYSNTPPEKLRQLINE